MAEVNTGSAEPGFVFGQNMEDRAIKPPPDTPDNGSEETKEENGTDGERASGPSPLRPSAFRPGGGVLAPSRLGANPFVPRPTGANHAILEVMPLNSNPFAAKVCTPSSLSSANSDSEDEKKDKPIVAPAHFSAQQGSTLVPQIVVTQDRADSEPANRFILKPSALDRQTANFNKSITSTSTSNNYKTSFKLEPAKLQSPLAAGQAKGSDQKENTTEQQSQKTSIERDETRQRLFGDASPPAMSGKENLLSAKAEEGKAETSETKSAQSGKETKSGHFVFGENMEKRVTNAAGASPPVTGSLGFVFGEKVSEKVVSAGATSPERSEKEKVPTTEQVSPSQTLAESAAAHQAKQTRPELQQVEVKTGEENESNVFQINAKLYAFDIASQSWLERGRGLLRLNDMSSNNEKGFKSRLVMRTTGSLRVILNTKVWAGMMVERASQKSVRVTAAEGEDSVKVFVIMANPNDADQIFSAIDWRVQQLKMAEPKEQPVASSQKDCSQESQESAVSTTSQSEKRQQSDTPDEAPAPIKKPRIEPDQRRDIATEESNDSSTLDPETEASNESFSSTTKSSSSSE